MELGIYTFVDWIADPKTHKKITAEQRMKNLLEEVVLADQVGLDVFGIGEHHRADFIVSSPIVPLAAAAALTKKIRLTSAVTVLSSDDPVRVFQNFAELDLISGGRAEILAGRGSFIESFPLFGYSLDDYDALFEEKLDLLLKIRDCEKVTWSGTHRAAIAGRGVYPRPVQNPMPIWVAVGGNPSSVIRAASLGLPLALAIIGGPPERFAPLIDLYRETSQKHGHDLKKMSVSINSQGYIAADAKQAAEEYFPYYEAVMNQIGKERHWSPITKSAFEASSGSDGSLILGTPEQVAAKILHQYEIFKNDRFLIQIDVGTMPHEKVMNAIKLLGTKVAPIVRAKLKKKR